MLSESAMLEGPVKRSHQDREAWRGPAAQTSFTQPKRHFMDQRGAISTKSTHTAELMRYAYKPCYLSQEMLDCFVSQ